MFTMPRSPKKDICIIGYSLRLPESDNATEFHENLINKVNMVTKDERRWPAGYNDTPEYFGKLKQSLDYFDHVFFGIHGKQAERLDPQLRLLLETSFEALMNAGVFPEDIKGSSTGVYVGGCFSDAHRLWMKDSQDITGYEHTGCAGTMFANRLSYFYDIHGPSFQIDTACASSLTALHYALKDLQEGKCDTAFVSGNSILLHSVTTVAFNKLNMLSPDGFCKTFDNSANGYTRSEGIVTLLLTTRADITPYTPYAKILASSVNTCGYHENGISFPSHHWQADLYKQLIENSNIQPAEINHIECHGTGTVAGDAEEIFGIKNFFGDRADLTLGALKSNMGHAEGASGLANIAKVLLGYENQTLYPQLHLQERMPGLGNLRTITEPEPWKGGKTLVNSFGFGGANASVLLDNMSSEGTVEKPWHGLYFISSRTKEGLYQLKRELEKSPQQLPVFKDLRYPWREVIGIPDDLQLEFIESRSVYFVFSGNGSQWQGMGLHLLQTSALFKETLYQCGRDIPKLLTKGWQGPLNDTRLLTALQIGLIELLKSFGITADGYVAHSAGEIAASYASGATTLRETMAIAKARGLAAEKMPDGLMISVGLNKTDVLPYIRNADKVVIACINSPRNVTLSGDRKQLESIMQQLQREEIFVRELKTHGKPYHSSLIDRKKVNTQLKRAFKGNVKRHSAWVSAIFDYSPEEFSIDYHVESVTRPVDFLGAMSQLPANAIALEIGPHSVLRALIRDCVPSLKYVSLMSKDTNDFEAFKLGIGRLWTLGANLAITPDKVRPSLTIRAKQVAWKRDYFPVPRDDFNERKFKQTFTFDLQGKDAYLLGHLIDGKPIFPAMGYVYVFWQGYLQINPGCGVVTLDNFNIRRSVPLIGEKLKMDVRLSPGGTFELIFNDELIAEAKLYHKEAVASSSKACDFQPEDTIPKETFYRFCHNEGYTYADHFQVIKEIGISDDLGTLSARMEFQEWISFLDGLLQISLLLKQTPGLRLPTSIRHIELSTNKADEAVYNRYVNSISCGEILIDGLETTLAGRRKETEAIVFLKEDVLVLGKNDDNNDSLYLEKILSTVRENSNLRINLFEIGTGTADFLKQTGKWLQPKDIINCTDSTLNHSIPEGIASSLNVNYSPYDLNKEMSSDIKAMLGKADLVVASHALYDSQNVFDYLHNVFDAMKPGAFLLLQEITSPLCLPLLGINNNIDERVNDICLTANKWISLLEAAKFKLLSYATTPGELMTTFLVRKPFTETYEVLAAPTMTYNEVWANHIKNAPGPFIFYSQEPGGVSGFARALTCEGKRALSFYAPHGDTFMDEVKAYGLVTNIVADGQLATLCYTTPVPQVSQTVDAYHLEFTEPGNLDEYAFIRNKPRQGQSCHVAFAALNFRDVMFASGKINKETFLGFSKDSSGIGMEFSGTSKGKRIMGIGMDAIANEVQTDFYWEIPAAMELAGAATIPVAYLTAFYAFFERAHIKPAHKVLVHGGSGAVGQAAIHVALDVGCEVFTTCQEGKREYLKNLFPSLDDAHIGDSRSTQFERQLLEKTEGRGVDIVLNSLADDKLQASLRCLAQHGVFIEIGKYDLMRNTPIGMKHLLPNTTICGVDVDQIFTDAAVMKRLSAHLSDGLKRGVVVPLDHTVFKSTEIAEAFRFLGTGKHVGKVLVDMQQAPDTRIIERFYTKGTHLIVGGLGGFGMALAEWLAARGAQHLILMSRKGVTTGEQTLFIKRVKNKYPLLKIDISTADLIQLESAQTFMKSCPPLTGIYNLSLVLNDTFFDGMTKEKWEETVNCKAQITRHLDQLTRGHPVEYFVCYSSLAVHGNPGQANYAYANNFMETICYERKLAGYPALAMQWGAIGNVGFVAKQDSAFVDLLNEALGTSLQSIDSCLTYLEKSMLSSDTVNLVYRSHTPENKALAEKADIFTRIGQILKIDLNSIPETTNLTALGLDSLQSAEIQSVISHAVQEIIPIPKLAKMTIAELKAMFQEGAEKVVAPAIDKTPDTHEIIAVPALAEPVKKNQEPDVNVPRRSTKMLRKLTQRSFKLLFKTRCPVSYEGLEHLPKDTPFLLCANQASHLDILSLIYASNRDANDFVAFTAKDHLNNSLMNRLKKIFLPMVVEFFPIDRHAGNSLNWEDTLVSLKPYVDSKKILTIFPEGTRTKTGEMQDFKLGASYLAHQLNLPIVPAYISGTYHCLPHNKTIPKKGPITITFGKPMVFDDDQVEQSPYTAYQNFTEKLYQDVVRLRQHNLTT